MLRDNKIRKYSFNLSEQNFLNEPVMQQAQGEALEYLSIFLGDKTFFNHGQLYPEFRRTRK